jgi:hypothetical protein
MINNLLPFESLYDIIWYSHYIHTIYQNQTTALPDIFEIHANDSYFSLQNSFNESHRWVPIRQHILHMNFDISVIYYHKPFNFISLNSYIYDDNIKTHLLKIRIKWKILYLHKFNIQYDHKLNNSHELLLNIFFQKTAHPPILETLSMIYRN